MAGRSTLLRAQTVLNTTKEHGLRGLNITGAVWVVPNGIVTGGSVRIDVSPDWYGTRRWVELATISPTSDIEVVSVDYPVGAIRATITDAIVGGGSVDVLFLWSEE